MIYLQDVVKELILETVARDKIMSAIENKDEVTIYYRDDSAGDEVLAGYRRCAPLVYGINKQSGNPVVRCWIFQKSVSKTYPPGKPWDPLTYRPGYRVFRVDRIHSVRRTGRRFKGPFPKYNPNDRDMSTIYVAAQF